MIKETAIFFIAYILLHFLVDDSNKKKGKSSKKIYIISLLHSLYVCYECWNILLKHKIDETKHIFDNSPNGSVNVFFVLVSYLLFDLIIMAYENALVPSFIIHHISCSLAVFLGAFYGKCLYPITMLLLSEMSTIPLNLTKLVKNKESIDYMRFLFVITFVIFRTLLIPYVYMTCLYNFEYFLRDHISTSLLLLLTVHLCVNMYWTKLIWNLVFETKKKY